MKEAEEEMWELRRWWLRMHGDNFRFIEGKAALQFAYANLYKSEFIIFTDPDRPFLNTPSCKDSFPIKHEINFTLEL